MMNYVEINGKKLKFSYMKLRELRVQSKKTWKDIRKDINISNDMVSEINKDGEIINTKSLVKLADYFNCGIDDLIDIIEIQK